MNIFFNEIENAAIERIQKFAKIANTMGFPNNCASRIQAKELLLYNVLINVSKYMNDGWNPDFNDTNESKWYVYCQLGEFIKNSIC